MGDQKYEKGNLLVACATQNSCSHLPLLTSIQEAEEVDHGIQSAVYKWIMSKNIWNKMLQTLWLPFFQPHFQLTQCVLLDLFILIWARLFHSLLQLWILNAWWYSTWTLHPQQLTIDVSDFALWKSSKKRPHDIDLLCTYVHTCMNWGLEKQGGLGKQWKERKVGI